LRVLVQKKRRLKMLAVDLTLLYIIMTYFVGYWVGCRITNKKYEGRLSTPRQTVQSSVSIDGEARPKAK